MQALQQQQILLIGLCKLIDACCTALQLAYSSHRQVANQTFFLPYCVAAMACFARLHYFLHELKVHANTLYSKIDIASQTTRTFSMPANIDSIDDWLTCTPQDLFCTLEPNIPVAVDTTDINEHASIPITNTLSDKYFQEQSKATLAPPPPKQKPSKKQRQNVVKPQAADEIDDIFGDI